MASLKSFMTRSSSLMLLKAPLREVMALMFLTGFPDRFLFTIVFTAPTGAIGCFRFLDGVPGGAAPGATSGAPPGTTPGATPGATPGGITPGAGVTTPKGGGGGGGGGRRRRGGGVTSIGSPAFASTGGGEAEDLAFVALRLAVTTFRLPLVHPLFLPNPIVTRWKA